ncbi:mitochondrial import inner membrane translocase subunit Tim13-like [Scaptodrosophila lebanonensis]|uniref:Mitochondrial import inner membrane translocase subunit n=1 Tax=Drosophila lebanonensis TaxID=7225 RepID=A0A6J2TSV6_DROLE|nr:mitochondrial import inner membrane translocase subunit Tim13-like [Scaptodrosophila lebanonensis]
MSSLPPGDHDSSDDASLLKQLKVKHQIKQEAALANVQDMLNKMTQKCFQKCINHPAESLAGYEQKCIAMCVDRYMESYRLVARTYGERLQREHSKLSDEEIDELGRQSGTM